jgi:hypothetical protein
MCTLAAPHVSTLMRGVMRFLVSFMSHCGAKQGQMQLSRKYFRGPTEGNEVLKTYNNGAPVDVFLFNDHNL